MTNNHLAKMIGVWVLGAACASAGCGDGQAPSSEQQMREQSAAGTGGRADLNPMGPSPESGMQAIGAMDDNPAQVEDPAPAGGGGGDIGSEATEAMAEMMSGATDDCGDGRCGDDENCTSCARDCGCEDSKVCVGGSCDTCGNGVCDPDHDEDCANCSADCGACLCEPGDSESEACGNCGSRERSCEAGDWGPWATCSGEGGCAPGDSESESCGQCGTRERSCGDDCAWGDFGQCTDEGGCRAGETETRPCGNCGTQMRTCSSECGWGAWSACSDQGACRAGQSETRSCADGCGTQRRSCSSSCGWGGWGACEGASEDFTLRNNWDIVPSSCGFNIFGWMFLCDGDDCVWVEPNSAGTLSNLPWGQSATLTYACCNVDPGLCYVNRHTCTIEGNTYDCTCTDTRSIRLTADTCPSEVVTLCN